MVKLMDKNKIIETYNATDVIVTDDLLEWIRSDHAGETGGCLDLQGR